MSPYSLLNWYPCAVQLSRYLYAWLDPSTTITPDDWKSVYRSNSLVGSLRLSYTYGVTQRT